VNDDEDAVRRAIIDSYRIVCICNKIRKGIIEKAMRGGARTFDDVKRRTRAGTGDCKAERCGPVIREMLAARKT